MCIYIYICYIYIYMLLQYGYIISSMLYHAILYQGPSPPSRASRPWRSPRQRRCTRGGGRRGPTIIERIRRRRRKINSSSSTTTTTTNNNNNNNSSKIVVIVRWGSWGTSRTTSPREKAKRAVQKLAGGGVLEVLYIILWFIMVQYLILWYVMLAYSILYDIISYHIISYDYSIVQGVPPKSERQVRVLMRRKGSSLFWSYYIVLYHIILCYVILYYVISQHSTN